MAVLTERKLEAPFTLEKIRDLKIGEVVMLAGRLVTGRDRALQFLFENGAAPADLRKGAIYHCGPAAVRREGQWVIQACGPTTSIRQERYTPFLMEKFDLRVIIGKGGMGPDTQKACAKGRCVYLEAVGGCAALLAATVSKVENVYLIREFGLTEAMWELSVKDFPAVVAIDAHGRSLRRRIEAGSKRALRKLLSKCSRAQIL